MQIRPGAAALGLVLACGGAPPASATPGSATVVLRTETCLPAGSTWARGLRSWRNALHEATSGSADLDVVHRNCAREDEIVTDLLAGRLDVALIGSVGLAPTVPEIRVLEVPHLLPAWSDLDAARTAIRPSIDATLAAHDLVLLGWADEGDAHVFSSVPVTVPSDLAGRRGWVHPADAVVEALLLGQGGVPVVVGLDQVLFGLSGNALDVVVATPARVAANGWAAYVTHASDAPLYHAGGVMLMRASRLAALSPALRTELTATAVTAESVLTRLARVLERRATATLITGHGVVLDPTSASADAWQAAGASVATALAGRSFPTALYDAVVDALP